MMSFPLRASAGLVFSNGIQYLFLAIFFLADRSPQLRKYLDRGTTANFLAKTLTADQTPQLRK